jgi:hypothetical protein
VTLTGLLLLRRQGLWSILAWRSQASVALLAMALAAYLLPLGSGHLAQLFSSAAAAVILMLLLAAKLKPWRE